MLLAFFALVVATTVGLIAWRGDEITRGGEIESPVSRTGAFLANNLLFGSFAFVVLLGTVFPLLIEAADGSRISVGNPYFERMTMPIGFALLFLMAVAPALPWGRAGGELLSKRLVWPASAGAVSMVVAVVIGSRGWAPTMAVGLAGFAVAGAVRQLLLAVRARGLRGLTGRSSGGMVVHIGVAVVAVAFACSSSFLRQAEFSFDEVGDTASIAGHTLVFNGIESVALAEKSEVRVSVLVDGELQMPAISTFPFGGQTIGTPATRSTIWDDVQLAVLSVPDGSGSTIIRVTVQPLVWWLWFGGGGDGSRNGPGGSPGSRQPLFHNCRDRGVHHPTAGPGMNPVRTAALAVGLVGAVLVGVLATRQAGPDRVSMHLVGEVAPPIAGMTIDGEVWNLDDQRGLSSLSTSSRPHVSRASGNTPSWWHSPRPMPKPTMSESSALRSTTALRR